MRTTVRSLNEEGTAPRAWGEFPAAAITKVTGRYSPTGVGRIVSAFAQGTFPPVQPHGRGENEKTGDVLERKLGTAPRAWGEWETARRELSATRYSPTGVGRIRSQTASRVIIRVQPHGRGEN